MKQDTGPGNRPNREVQAGSPGRRGGKIPRWAKGESASGVRQAEGEPDRLAVGMP